MSFAKRLPIRQTAQIDVSPGVARAGQGAGAGLRLSRVARRSAVASANGSIAVMFAPTPLRCRSKNRQRPHLSVQFASVSNPAAGEDASWLLSG